MKRFLADYWMWIAAPPLLVVLLVIVALVAGDESVAPIDYVLF